MGVRELSADRHDGSISDRPQPAAKQSLRVFDEKVAAGWTTAVRKKWCSKVGVYAHEASRYKIRKTNCVSLSDFHVEKSRPATF